MTQLATRGATNGVPAEAQPQAVSLASSPLMTLAEVWEMAGYVFESQLFPVKTQQQAFTLMMLAQSEGLHPIQAMRRYDIIDGKPALKSAAIQAEFQRLGGRIVVGLCNEQEANAEFSHPVHQPTPVAMRTTFEHYKKIGLTDKKNWKSDPEAMLWWRLVSKGVRRIYPGIVVGIYSAEEVDDVGEAETPSARHAAARHEAEAAVVAADVAVPGWYGSGYDDRQYHQVAGDALDLLNAETRKAWAGAFGTDLGAPKAAIAPDLHRHVMLRAINLGLADGPPPAKVGDAVKALGKLYKTDREWVRSEVVAWLAERSREAGELIAERTAAGENVEPMEPGSNG